MAGFGSGNSYNSCSLALPVMHSDANIDPLLSTSCKAIQQFSHVLKQQKKEIPFIALLW